MEQANPLRRAHFKASTNNYARPEGGNLRFSAFKPRWLLCVVIDKEDCRSKH